MFTLEDGEIYMEETNNLIKKYFNFIIILILFAYFVLNNSKIVEFLSMFTRILAPFLAGIFIMFLLEPVISNIQNFLNKRIHKQSVCSILSIIITYIFFIIFVVSIIVICVPQLINSITEISVQIPILWHLIIEKVNIYLPGIDEYKSISNILTTKVNELVNYIPNIITWLSNVLRFGINLCIAIVFAIYLSFEKSKLILNIKRFIKAFCKENTIYIFTEVYQDCKYIFNKFVAGKIIDSLIVGILCIIILLIFRIPYALFLGIIFGITNMIPYFGPLFGYIFGFLILISIHPTQAIIYLIISIALQILDGYLIGPFILKDRIGLSPLWILLSVTVGGAICGIPGMFLGTPIVAAVARILNKIITKRIGENNV